MHRQVGRTVTIALLLAHAAVPAWAAGPIERLSVGPGGIEGDGPSAGPALSAQGRFVAFSSDAANLVPGGNRGGQVFVRDRETHMNQVVSVGPGGAEGDRTSRLPKISAFGRFVAFESTSTNLVPGDLNGKSDVFVHDRRTGITQRVSVSSSGVESDGNSFVPTLSADGRFVAFSSDATTLASGDSGGPFGSSGVADVFLHDRRTAVTRRLSNGPGGVEGNLNSTSPALSADGRFVAFQSDATNLVPGDSRGGLFVHERPTGITLRLNIESNGVAARVQSPVLSANGRFVAFSSDAANLVPGDTNGELDVFVHDRETGKTRRVSRGSGGRQSNGASFRPALSEDGRWVAFVSEATNLVPGDTNSMTDVFAYDRRTQTTRRVSVGPGGVQATGVSGSPALSANGRWIGFDSEADNLVPNDNNASDVFVRKLGP